MYNSSDELNSVPLLLFFMIFLGKSSNAIHSPRSLHCFSLFLVTRVVHVFGDHVKEQINDITPTFLSQRVLATLRNADSLANHVLHESGLKLIVIIIN